MLQAAVIAFIIKIAFAMQPSTPISAYKQAQECESPTVPSVLRPRHKPKVTDGDPLRRIRQLATHPAEIVIDANKYNQQQGLVVGRGQEGIRGEIDACLTALDRVYEQQIKRKSNRGILTEVGAGEPVISTNSIHRVDARLILKYIGTIKQDYGLSDRFGQARRNIIQHHSPHTQPSRNPQQRFTSTDRRGKSKKSFINMTLSTNREKRADSGVKHISTVNRGKSPSTIHSPLNSRHQKPSQSTSPIKQPISHRIPEQFKFCISCQQSILSSNINYHQQYECTQLQQLYQLPFPELKQFIAQKINRFRRTLHEKLENLKANNPKENEPRGKLCQEVVGSIQKYLDELQGDDQTRELSFLQVRDNYLKFQQTIRGDFFDCIALTHKLDYFIKVYVQLTRTGSIDPTVHSSPPKAPQIEIPASLGGEEGERVLPVSHFEVSQQ